MTSWQADPSARLAWVDHAMSSESGGLRVEAEVASWVRSPQVGDVYAERWRKRGNELYRAGKLKR